MRGSKILTTDMNSHALDRFGRHRDAGDTPDRFERITDLLADLVLEDLMQYSQLGSSASIDRLSRRENTALVTGGSSE